MLNIEELTKIIQDAYESEVTMSEAERHAARFLHASIEISTELRRVDLDARMKKTSLKAIKAGVYLSEATKDAKKPSDVMLSAIVDQAASVIQTQDLLDTAEVDRNHLQSKLDMCHEAHVYFRSIARGRFE